MTRNRALVLATVLVLAGCSGEGSELPPGGILAGGEPGEGLGTFDPEDSNTETTGGCEHVDLVFAVDNSGSMQEEKDAMRDIVFPAFAQKLSSIPSIVDFRAAVLDACPTPASYHTRGAGGDCNFQSGQVWMDSTSSDLEGEFRCVADIDSSNTQCSGSNDDEQPASTAAVSLEPPWSTGDNAGFSRDDALLVVVAITDEDETPVPDQSAQEIHARLVASKPSKDHVVFLGIAGKEECDGVYGNAEHAPAMQELAGLFSADGQGLFWDLCAGSLDQGLEAALTTIEAACSGLEPLR